MEQSATSDVLAERVDKLERLVRRWRALTIATALTMAALSGMVVVLLTREIGAIAFPRSTPTQKEIVTNKLTIVDMTGKERARLALDEGGLGVGLTLLDQSGKSRITLRLDALDTPKLAFLGEDGSERVSLSSQLGDWQTLEFTNGGKALLTLSLMGNYPTLDLSDEKGHSRVNLEFDPDDSIERLRFYGKGNGKSPSSGKPSSAKAPERDPSVALIGTDNIEFLSFDDKRDRNRELFSLDTDGSPSISLSDEKQTRTILGTASLENTKTGATEKTAPSSLVLFDKEGKLIYQIPR